MGTDGADGRGAREASQVGLRSQFRISRPAVSDTSLTLSSQSDAKRGDAEDVLQDTFVRAYQYLAEYKPGRSFKTWIFTIAYRLMLNHLRKARSRAAVELAYTTESSASDPPGPGARVESEESEAQVWQIARSELTEHQYSVLWLHCVEQMSLMEVGRVIGQTGPSVRSALHRARKKLLPRLEPHHLDPKSRPTLVPCA